MTLPYLAFDRFRKVSAGMSLMGLENTPKNCAGTRHTAPTGR
ncbi:MAG TPA: hypothetical protein VGJ19_17790 [Streptosporangiaceae bacterium]